MHPNYHTRLAAHQLKATDRSGRSFFEPAPPLEALRTVVGLAAAQAGSHRSNWDPQFMKRTQISFVEIKRAYFNGTINPQAAPTYVNLPDEDPDSKDLCAILLCHMYGTRRGWMARGVQYYSRRTRIPPFTA